MFEKKPIIKGLLRRTICLIDYANNLIIDETKCQYTVEYERDIVVDDREDKFT